MENLRYVIIVATMMIAENKWHWLLLASSVLLVSIVLVPLLRREPTKTPYSLGPGDVAEIEGVVQGLRRRLLWDDTCHRLGAQNLLEMLDRWIYERIREIEVEPDGRVCVYARTRRKPRSEGAFDPKYFGHGEKFFLRKTTRSGNW